MCNFVSSNYCVKFKLEDMSKILVGFDFSTGSAYAVDLAIDIANRYKCDLRLVYVKEKDQDEGPIREEIERRNAGVAHLLKGIKLEYVIREGKVSQELCAQARRTTLSLSLWVRTACRALRRIGLDATLTAPSLSRKYRY